MVFNFAYCLSGAIIDIIVKQIELASFSIVLSNWSLPIIVTNLHMFLTWQPSQEFNCLTWYISCLLNLKQSI